MSLLGFVNRVIFQWFCVRLAKNQESRVEDFMVESWDLVCDGVAPRGHGKIVKYQWYSLMYWVVPLTGWGSDYIFLNDESKFIRLTKDKKI